LKDGICQTEPGWQRAIEHFNRHRRVQFARIQASPAYLVAGTRGDRPTKRWPGQTAVAQALALRTLVAPITSSPRPMPRMTGTGRPPSGIHRSTSIERCARQELVCGLPRCADGTTKPSRTGTRAQLDPCRSSSTPT
jgi:hypothetical protein